VGTVVAARDRNPDPTVFSTRLVARPARLDLNGDGLRETVWTFNRQVPGPEIRVEAGTIIDVRFKNRLPVPSSIHWHGITLTNSADGTPVTQNEVPPGGTFRYRFQVGDPGVFWYHPHFRPSNQAFKGLYGSLIVTGKDERKLARLGVIPKREETLVLSDITVCKEPGENDDFTFPADPGLPWAGPTEFPGNVQRPSPRDLCERPMDARGIRQSTPLQRGAVPNVQPGPRCVQGVGPPCRVNMGQWVLTNGRRAAPRSGSPQAPGDLVAEARALSVAPGEPVRLRLINAALFRYFRLLLTDASGTVLPIYRIGGEAGLLNRVRVEGGVDREFDTKYDRGEIVLGPSERADVVIVAEGSAGDLLTLWTRDFPHTGRGFAVVPTVPVLHLEIAESTPGEFSIGPRTPLLTDPRVDRPFRGLKGRKPTARLVDPGSLGVGVPGTSSPTIRFTNTSGPSIDGVPGFFDAAAVDDFRKVPFLASSRFARVGDLLRVEAFNDTGAHHVLHLHGFFFQPLKLQRGGRTVHRFRYPEFVDSIDIPPAHGLVFKLLLEDRPLVPGSPSSGGAIGRWLLHCHIFPHASLGMMSELVVLPAE
jgi:FtsP/CotA-like multicopper oxidase with cupredoxin domain